MPIAIRKLFGLSLFVQILCLDSAPLARADEIRVLYYPPWNISKLPLYLARDTGIFERSGLQQKRKKMPRPRQVSAPRVGSRGDDCAAE